METLRESVIQLYHGQWIVRVWRGEQMGVPVNHSDVFDASFRSSQHDMTGFALELLAIDRVNAVEVKDQAGWGEVLYKDWP